MRSSCPEVEAKWPPRDHAGRVARPKANPWPLVVAFLVFFALVAIQTLIDRSSP